MESLKTILLSMNNTLEEFCGVVSLLEKVVHDSRLLTVTGSSQPTAKQLRQRIGIKPSLEDCLDGLRLLEEMHQSDVSADLGALQQLMVDQPNIPHEDIKKKTFLTKKCISYTTSYLLRKSLEMINNSCPCTSRVS